MVDAIRVFSGFAVRDVGEARTFYADKLGLTVGETMGSLTIDLGDGHQVFVYPKPDHRPATYTVLNLEVADIDAAVTQLEAAHVRLLRYDGFGQDERGISRPEPGEGPLIGWFTDPSGNIISVLQTPGA